MTEHLAHPPSDGCNHWR